MIKKFKLSALSQGFIKTGIKKIENLGKLLKEPGLSYIIAKLETHCKIFISTAGSLFPNTFVQNVSVIFNLYSTNRLQFSRF